MTTVFVTYKLKPTTDPDEYRKWSLERDQPTASAQTCVVDFSVHMLDAESQESFFDVIEVIRVTSREAWLQALDLPVLQQIATELRSLVDESSIVTVYADQITEDTP